MEQNENLYPSEGVHGKGTVYVIVFTWLDVSVGLQEKKQPTRANSQGWLQYSCVLASLPVAVSVYWIQCHSMGGILLWASLALDWFFGSLPYGCVFYVSWSNFGGGVKFAEKREWNGFLLANVIEQYSVALEALSWLKQLHRTQALWGYGKALVSS